MKEYKGLKIPTVTVASAKALNEEQESKYRELSEETVYPLHCDGVFCEECLYSGDNFETYKQYIDEGGKS